MFVLNQSHPYPDPASIEADSVHRPDLFPLLSHFPKAEIKVQLMRSHLSGLERCKQTTDVQLFFFFCRQSFSTTPSSCLSVTRLSVSSPPTETSSRKTISTTTRTLAGTSCVSTATNLIHRGRWTRRLQQACVPHFTTSFSTCWTQKRRRKPPLSPTGSRCIACVTPASYSKNPFSGCPEPPLLKQQETAQKMIFKLIIRLKV